VADVLKENMKTKQQAINNGWIYSEEPHPVLKLDFAMKKTNEGVKQVFSDKVKYNEREMFILRSHNIRINYKMHSIKKILGGEIFKIESI
jgi:predicted patatin/cPLA2 family phospholipase